MLAHMRRSIRPSRGPILVALLMTTAALAADDLTPLNDEFDDASTLGQWQRIYLVEQWPVDHLEVYDLDSTQPGRLVMIPFSRTWFQDRRSTLAFKDVTGDMVITTEVFVDDRDPSDGNQLPARDFSLAGLMIRTPRTVTPATWTPGGENYVFLALGNGASGGSEFQFEVKNTVNSVSNLTLTSAGSSNTQIQIARIGDAVITLRRLPGDNWQVHQRYTRADFPAALQVGFVAYADWATASVPTPFVHNTTVESGLPDLIAGFEYARFARPVVPPALIGLDMANPAEVSDAELLSFLGAIPAALPEIPPAVSGVYVRGSAWAPGFLDFLANSGFGSAGYLVPDGSNAQLDPLPWTTIDQIVVEFTEDVLVQSGDLTLLGVNTPNPVPSAFSYDSTTFRATWSLAAPIAVDKLRIRLSSAIQSPTGVALDGEWSDGLSTYPSGDGSSGGDFVFRLNVIAGDVNQNGGVNIQDIIQTRNRQGSSVGVPLNYSIHHDVNANSGINIQDTILVRNRLGSTLPPGEPAP